MSKLLIATLFMFLVAAGCYDPAKVIITNGLEDRNIEYVYVSSGSEEEWGTSNLPNWKVLKPGESHEITVLPDTYDLQVVDQYGETYTVWDVEIETEDYEWKVVPSDMD
jgi:hypothetical protein